ncbi:MAG TPA: hypothetical protein VFA07_08815 [Chthonomonadaceae bacterium]|nr:hypothetical protein [Chthonomonadaceae bacterium]
MSSQHREALTDPQAWQDNPFATREARRDLRRKQPVKSLAWMCGALLVLGGPALWGLRWLYREGYGIPWYLGGDLGAVLCILVSGIHIWLIAGAAQKHTTNLLTQEAARNTLPSLLLLPQSPFQTIVQTAVYPWRAAMRIALVLLPAYVLCVGLDGISWADLMMLYLVFAMTAVSFPVWRSPALTATGTPAAAPEASAKTAGMQGQTTGATGSSGSSPGGWLALGFLLPMFALFSALVSRRGVGGMLGDLHRYMPDSIIVLLPSSLLSWPLLMARALITPFEWFGWPVPPLPFALFLFALGRYVQVVRTSEYLSVGTYRDLALLPTYLPRRRLEGALRIAGALIATGYLWHWAIRDGALALLAASTDLASPGLAGFLYALLFVAAWRGMVRAGQLGGWLRESRSPVTAAAVRSVTLRSAAVFFCAPFLSALAFYLACCALSRTPPFSRPLVVMAGEMLVIALAGALLNFGASRLLGLLTLLWPLVLIGLLVFGPPESYRVMLLSPTLGLLHLSRYPLVLRLWALRPSFLWWMWPVDCGLAGAFLALCALPRTARSPASVPEGALALDPTKVGSEVFGDPPLTKTATAVRSESPLTLRFIAATQRFGDNALTTKELRVRLRGRLHLSSLRRTFLIYLVVSGILGVGLPAIADAFGGGVAAFLYGDAAATAAGPAASVLACFYLALLFVAAGAGFSLLLAFAAEREKATLGFVLLSPMRSRAIVLGKMAGMLLAASPALLTLGAWTLLLSLFLLPALGAISLIAWIEMVLMALSLAVSIGTVMLAIASLFPRAISPASMGLLGWVVLQAIAQIGFHSSRYLRHLARNGTTLAAGQSGLFWLVTGFVCLLFALLGFLTAVWGVRRMRKGDIAFAASKQEN